MLFTSFLFLFLFLPLVVCGYALTGIAQSEKFSLWYLILVSLVFYAWGNPRYLIVLVGSLLFNYGIGLLMHGEGKRAKTLLAVGISFDLAVLFFFKYAGFFTDNLNVVLGTNLPVMRVALPLGISFFTFQQIAYRMQIYDGKMIDSFSEYCAAVTFFPHLIAGPIVNYRELIPQFRNKNILQLHPGNLCIGMFLFGIGLLKKLLADRFLAEGASKIFDIYATGGAVGWTATWWGALCFTLQLYYDFSGYCDMALGLGALFNLRLPLNFLSPFKSKSITEFWQRWHITLSRFIQTYLFMPLWQSTGRRLYLSQLVAMTLCGLWHGANWTFVVFGSLHGIGLVTHTWWRTKKFPCLPSWLALPVTFVYVIVAFVFFRAPTLHSAWSMCLGLMGAISAPHFSSVSLGTTFGIWMVTALLIVALKAPNIYEWMGEFSPAIEIQKPVIRWDRFNPSLAFGASAGVAFFSALLVYGATNRVFLYFNF